MDESKDQIQEVEKSGERLEHQADEMKERTDELGSDIDTARKEFERRHSDSDDHVVAPETENESSSGSSGSG